MAKKSPVPDEEYSMYPDWLEMPIPPDPEPLPDCYLPARLRKGMGEATAIDASRPAKKRDAGQRRTA
jgi:hypothetical protein